MDQACGVRSRPAGGAFQARVCWGVRVRVRVRVGVRVRVRVRVRAGVRAGVRVRALALK